MRDYDKAYGMKYVSLRYFNACGADLEADVGEWPGSSSNLIPLVLDAAIGKREDIKVFGTDYETPDGTCIRDYIHVTDLADAHIKALNYLAENKKSLVVNLGTGDGNSVKELIDLSKKITGKEIKSEIVSRRAGDPAVLVANNTRAETVLGWKPKYGLEEIINSSWKWHQNPKY